jgi:hypothetical protein
MDWQQGKRLNELSFFGKALLTIPEKCLVDGTFIKTSIGLGFWVCIRVIKSRKKYNIKKLFNFISTDAAAVGLL